MKLILASAILALMTLPASAFDLQGHRGARGLAPENTIPGFETALRIGVTTLELDLAMTKDGVLVVSHDSQLNPEHTRGPDGDIPEGAGPGDPLADASPSCSATTSDASSPAPPMPRAFRRRRAPTTSASRR